MKSVQAVMSLLRKCILDHEQLPMVYSDWLTYKVNNQTSWPGVLPYITKTKIFQCQGKVREFCFSLPQGFVKIMKMFSFRKVCCGRSIVVSHAFRCSVSGFRCECLLPNKEEKSEEAWEPVFSFGHFYQSVVWSVEHCFHCLENLNKCSRTTAN